MRRVFGGVLVALAGGTLVILAAATFAHKEAGNPEVEMFPSKDQVLARVKHELARRELTRAVCAAEYIVEWRQRGHRDQFYDDTKTLYDALYDALSGSAQYAIESGRATWGPVHSSSLPDLRAIFDGAHRFGPGYEADCTCGVAYVLADTPDDYDPLVAESQRACKSLRPEYMRPKGWFRDDPSRVVVIRARPPARPSLP